MEADYSDSPVERRRNARHSQLVALARSKNKHAANGAYSELMAYYLPVSMRLARHRLWVHEDDKISCAGEAVVSAVQTYDGSVPFSAFFHVVFRNRLCDIAFSPHYKNSRVQITETDLYAASEVRDGIGDDRLHHRRVYHDHALVRREQIEAVTRELKPVWGAMSRTERLACLSVHVLGYTYAQTAEAHRKVFGPDGSYGGKGARVGEVSVKSVDNSIRRAQSKARRITGDSSARRRGGGGFSEPPANLRRTDTTLLRRMSCSNLLDADDLWVLIQELERLPVEQPATHRNRAKGRMRKKKQVATKQECKEKA